MPIRLAVLLPAVVAVFAFLAFLPSLGGQWLQWDDQVNFVRNPDYRGLGLTQLRWMFTTTLLAVYIPLSWMTLGLNYVLGGMDPWGYHLGNMLLHAANAALLFVVARRLLVLGIPPVTGGDRPGWPTGAAVELGAVAAALVWAVHPLRVEAVAWVTERREVLAGLFYLIAVWTYLRAATGRARLARGWQAASMVAFLAALLSKGLTMTLPLTLLVLDVYPLRRWPRLGWWPLVREKLGYFALAALGAGVALWAVLREVRWTSYDEQGPLARLAMVGYSLWFYPSKLVWPVRLSPLYEIPEPVSLGEGRFLGALAGALLLTAVLVAARHRWPAGLAAWAHLVIVIAPVSGVVHAGPQLAHDRFSYLSTLGLSVAAGGALAGLLLHFAARRRWVPAAALGALLLVVAALGGAAWRQSHVWRDSEPLWRTAVAVEPDCVRCLSNLGATLLEGRVAGDPKLREAETYLRRALALRPTFDKAHQGLALLLMRERRYAEAEAVIGQMLRARPGAPEAQTLLADIYGHQGRFGEAIAVLRRAFEQGLGSPETRTMLGWALNNHGVGMAHAGHRAEAAAMFREAMDLLPAASQPRENAGRLLLEDRRAPEAVEVLRRAIALDPRNARARLWLAHAYRLTGDPARAAVEGRVAGG
ncbi:MAG TPA: tetratricopeptide repeat protein, partial [Candidatus Limnocylindrales bacterium]|nr:tetratricopeptide repeat protein [Candidatus Limnocylindrales bacterium]